jgi:hypothetical protein
MVEIYFLCHDSGIRVGKYGGSFRVKTIINWRCRSENMQYLNVHAGLGIAKVDKKIKNCIFSNEKVSGWFKVVGAGGTAGKYNGGQAYLNTSTMISMQKR